MQADRKANARRAAVALVLVVGVVAWVNSKSLRDLSEGVAGKFMRLPASAVFRPARSASPEVEKKYAQDLAQKKDRKLASIGHIPTQLDALSFGLLDGKYHVEMEGDYIQQITFIEAPDSDATPKVINDRVKFLMDHSALFGIDNVPQRVDVKAKGDRIIEKYRIASKKGGADTIIDVTVDESDHVFDVTREKSSRQLF